MQVAGQAVTTTGAQVDALKVSLAGLSEQQASYATLLASSGADLETFSLALKDAGVSTANAAAAYQALTGPQATVAELWQAEAGAATEATAAQQAFAAVSLENANAVLAEAAAIGGLTAAEAAETEAQAAVNNAVLAEIGANEAAIASEAALAEAKTALASSNGVLAQAELTSRDAAFAASTGYETTAASASKASSSAGSLAQQFGVLTLAAGAFAAVDISTKLQTDETRLADFAGLTQTDSQLIGQSLNQGFNLGVNSSAQFMAALTPVGGLLREVEGGAVNTAQTLQIMAAAQNLSVASGDSLTDSTRAEITVLRDFQLGASDATSVQNALYDSSIKTGQSVPQVAQAYEMLHEQLGAVNPSLSDTKMLLDAANQAGADGPRILNQIASGFGTLTSGSKASTDALLAYNIQIKDQNQNLLPVPQIIDNIVTSLSSYSSAQRDVALAALLGATNGEKTWQVLQDADKEYRSGSDDASAWANATRDAGTQADTTAGNINTLKAALEDLPVEAGNLAISRFTTTVNDAKVSWGNWFREIENDAEIFAGLPATFSLATEATQGNTAATDQDTTSLKEHALLLAENETALTDEQQAQIAVDNAVNTLSNDITIQNGKIKDAAAAWSGATVQAEALSAATWGLAEAFNAVAQIGGAEQKREETQATNDQTRAYTIETQAMQADLQGHTQLAAALRQEEAAYQSGDTAAEQAAARNVALAQTQDSLATKQDALNTKIGKEGVTATEQAGSAVKDLTDAQNAYQTALDKFNNDQITGASVVTQAMIAADQQRVDAGKAAVAQDLANWNAGIQSLSAAVASGSQEQIKLATDTVNALKSTYQTDNQNYTQAENDKKQASQAFATEQKVEADAVKAAASDEQASFSALQSYIKTLSENIPASLQTGLAQAESNLQQYQAQVTAIDQQLQGQLSVDDRQTLENKKANLQDELSTAKDTYSAESQAASDMSKAIADSDKARLDTHAQMLQQQTFDEQSAADNAIGIWNASIATQEQVNILGHKKNAAELNTILEQEAASVDYWTEQKIESDNAYKEIQVQNAQLTQDIDQQKASIEIALANLEVGLATQTAQAQIDSKSQVLNASAATDMAIAQSGTAAYQAVDQASGISSSDQINNLASVAQAAISTAQAQISADNQAISANDSLGASYQSASNGAQQEIDAAKALASNLTSISNAAASADSANKSLGSSASAASSSMKEESSIALTLAGSLGQVASAASSASASIGGISLGVQNLNGVLSAGSAGGSGSGAGLNGALTSGASGGAVGPSGTSGPNVLGAPNSITPDIAAQIAFIPRYIAAYGAGALPGFISSLQSEGYNEDPLIQALRTQGYSLPGFGGATQAAPISAAPAPGSQDVLTQAVQQGVTQAIQNLQQNGGLPVSVSNPQDVAGAVTSGTTSNLLSRPVGV